MARTAPPTIAAATSDVLVLPRLSGSDAAEVLSELAMGFAMGLDGVDGDAVRAQFEERESLSSTALGAGLAVPHCKLSRVDRAHLAVGVHREGVPFGAPDGIPTRLFLAVVSPASAPGAHLGLLAAIARWASAPGRVDAVVGARDAPEILRLLGSDEIGIAE